MLVRQSDPVDDAVVWKMPENSMSLMSRANGKDQGRLYSVLYIPKGPFHTAGYYLYRQLTLK